MLRYEKLSLFINFISVNKVKIKSIIIVVCYLLYYPFNNNISNSNLSTKYKFYF